MVESSWLIDVHTKCPRLRADVLRPREHLHRGQVHHAPVWPELGRVRLDFQRLRLRLCAGTGPGWLRKLPRQVDS